MKSKKSYNDPKVKYYDTENNFKGRHFEGVIILQCLRWYCKYALSYRDLEEITIHQLLKQFLKIQWYKGYRYSSWRVDETYIKVKGKWCYLLGLDSKDYSTHSIRRTRASLIYRKTGNIEAVRLLLEQKSVSSTSSYLNLDKQEALNIVREWLV